MFDLSLTKILVLVVIALVIFGPHELPKVAAQAGKMLRDLRRIAEGAKADLKEGLGPEFQDFEFEDLHPRRFVQKHLLDDDLVNDLKSTTESISTGMSSVVSSGATAASTRADSIGGATATATVATLPDGGDPPFDNEAT